MGPGLEEHAEAGLRAALLSDGGLAPAYALVPTTIERAAADRGFTAEELRGLPPGRTRRQHHDDISVLVLFLK